MVASDAGQSSVGWCMQPWQCPLVCKLLLWCLCLVHWPRCVLLLMLAGEGSNVLWAV